jgi:cadmium resistance protein CadD (predicted permease)
MLPKSTTDGKAEILFRIGDKGTADTVNTLNPKFFVASLSTTNFICKSIFKSKLYIICKVQKMLLSFIALRYLLEKYSSFLLEYSELC